MRAKGWMSIFIEESGRLSEGALNLSTFARESAHSLLYFGSPPDISILDISNLKRFPDSITRASRDAHVRTALALGLGIEDSGYMRRIVATSEFHLTPDFAVKLLALHNRRATDQNVILSGQTGVGKTELLSFYALF